MTQSASAACEYAGFLLTFSVENSLNKTQKSTRIRNRRWLCIYMLLRRELPVLKSMTRYARRFVDEIFAHNKNEILMNVLRRTRAKVHTQSYATVPQRQEGTHTGTQTCG